MICANCNDTGRIGFFPNDSPMPFVMDCEECSGRKYHVVTAWGFGTMKCNTCGSNIPVESSMCPKCKNNLENAVKISQARFDAEIDDWKRSSPFTAKWESHELNIA